MATATALFDLVRTQIADPDAERLTSARGVTYLNAAQKKLCSAIWPLERRKGFTVSAAQDRFALPTEAIIVEGAWMKREIPDELRYMDMEAYRRRVSASPTDSGTPRWYTIYEREIRVYPAFSSASKAILASGAIDSATTTFSVASTGNFTSRGRAVIGSQEEVEYTGKTSTTLTGVRRAVGSTSATTLASGDTLTQVDLELWYRRGPVSIATGGETPEIPDIWHEMMVPYILYLQYVADGKPEEAEQQLAIYNAFEQEVKNTIKRRQIAQLPRINDKRNRW